MFSRVAWRLPSKTVQDPETSAVQKGRVASCALLEITFLCCALKGGLVGASVLNCCEAKGWRSNNVNTTGGRVGQPRLFRIKNWKGGPAC